jgi:pyruvate/2-oxoglutarate dehydrogenase complex dihydrolipoamide acyltransferase (E2) component
VEQVTYKGPGSAYRVPDFEGKEYVLRAGQPLSVPEGLAKQLLATEGQHFEVHSEGPTVSDAARKLAEESGVDLAEIEGSGTNGSITKPDVEAAIEEASA